MLVRSGGCGEKDKSVQQAYTGRKNCQQAGLVSITSALSHYSMCAATSSSTRNHLKQFHMQVTPQKVL